MELGLIPNSSLINTTKRQWRIYLSKSAEEKLFKEMGAENYEENFTPYQKSFNSSANLEKEQNENGKKILFATVGILAFIYFVFIKPPSNSSKISSSTSYTTASNNNDGNSNYSSTSKNSPSSYIINTTTYGATSKKALDDMYIYLSNNDREAFATAMMYGDILEIPAGTNVYVKKNHFSYTIVKIAGRTEDIYVVTDHLTKK